MTYPYYFFYKVYTNRTNTTVITDILNTKLIINPYEITT